MYVNEKCHCGKYSKERLTFLLAVNIEVSEKLKPIIIGRTAKPRCFKGIGSFPKTYRTGRHG